MRSVLELAGDVEVGEEASELVVDQAEHAEVDAAIGAPGIVVAGPFFLDQGSQPGPGGAECGGVLGTGNAIGNRVLRKHGVVGLGHW